MNTMFKIRTDKQREISVNTTIKADLASTVRGLRELTHNIVEITSGSSVEPLEALLNYYAGEKAKINSALAVLRAVTFGVSAKIDDNTGRFCVTVKKEAGLNRHYHTLERFVAGGNAGLMNNTMHDALKSVRPPKASAASFDVEKRADNFVKAALDAGVSIDAMRKALDKAIKDRCTSKAPARPIMDTAPSHPATGSVSQMFSNAA